MKSKNQAQLHDPAKTQLEATTESLWLSNALDRIRYPDQPQAPELPWDLSARYTLHEQIGTGSFGVVYRAFDSKLGRSVAVKTLRPEYASSEKFCSRFEREAGLAGKVEHGNVARVYDVQAEDSDAFIVMELVEGQSLAELRRAPHEPDVRVVCRLLKQAVDGLSAAHNAGLIHRDIKSANILVTDDLAQVRLTDFGLAHDRDEVMSGVAGSLGYMSPEHLHPQQQVDERGDIYGMGVVLFEMLSGSRPFEGTPASIRQQILLADAPAVTDRNSAVSKDVATIVEKCLRKRPEDRYQTAAELANDLQAWLDGRPIQARPVGRIGRLVRWARREPVVAALGFMLASAIVAGSVFGIMSVREIVKQRDRAAAEAEFANGQTNRFLDVIDLLVTDVNQSLQTLPNASDLRQQILANAISKLEEVSTDLQRAPSFNTRLVDAHFKMARIYGVVGESAQAEGELQSALDVAQKLYESAPDDVDSQKILATAHLSLAEFVQIKFLDVARAKKGYQTALELTANYPKVPGLAEEHFTALLTMAQLETRLGESDKAESSFARVFRMLEVPKAAKNIPPEVVARAQEAYGLFLVQSVPGRTTEAIEKFREALVVREQQYQVNPDDALAAQNLSSCLLLLGQCEFVDASYLPSSLRHLSQAVEVAEEQANKFPNDLTRRRSVAVAHDALGQGCMRWGDSAGAFKAFRQALEILEGLAKADPQNKESLYDVMVQQMHIGEYYRSELDSENAKQSYLKAKELLAGLDDETATQAHGPGIDAEIAKSDGVELVSPESISLTSFQDGGLLVGSRMRQLVQRREFQQSRKLSEAIQEFKSELDPVIVFNIACMHAESANDVMAMMNTDSTEELSAEFDVLVELSMEILELLHTQGKFGDVSMALYLHQAKAIDVLRSLPRFKAIVDIVPDPMAASETRSVPASTSEL